MGWLGNEAADVLAKTGAVDIAEAWDMLLTKHLTSDLRKARELVRWLAQGVLPDGRLLREIHSQVFKADVDRAVLPDKHMFSVVCR